MNIEKSKRALEGQATQYAPAIGIGGDKDVLRTHVTADFAAAIENLAYEQGHSVSALIRKVLKEYLQNAIYEAEAKAGRYNAPPMNQVA